MDFKQKGFSLLEVLISIVVLTIGLLGVAALQGSSIRYNHSAQLRAIAIAQGHSMADRIKANKAGVSAGAYNAITGIPSQTSCTSCSPTQLAQYDAYKWNTINAALLPSGRGTVTSANNRYTITVRWDGNRTGATGLGCSGNKNIDLDCFSMEIQP